MSHVWVAWVDMSATSNGQPQVQGMAIECTWTRIRSLPSSMSSSTASVIEPATPIEIKTTDKSDNQDADGARGRAKQFDNRQPDIVLRPGIFFKRRTKTTVWQPSHQTTWLRSSWCCQRSCGEGGPACCADRYPCKRYDQCGLKLALAPSWFISGYADKSN